MAHDYNEMPEVQEHELPDGRIRVRERRRHRRGYRPSESPASLDRSDAPLTLSALYPMAGMLAVVLLAVVLLGAGGHAKRPQGQPLRHEADSWPRDPGGLYIFHDAKGNPHVFGGSTAPGRGHQKPDLTRLRDARPALDPGGSVTYHDAAGKHQTVRPGEPGYERARAAARAYRNLPNKDSASSAASSAP
jgi:hypothetical protein